MIERVAAWKTDLDAEREIARERRTATILRGTTLGVGLAAFGLCPVSCLSVFPFSWDDPLLVVRSVLTGLVVVAFVAASSMRKGFEDRRERFRDERFPSAEGWTVDLLILQGDTPTGIDRGVVWFEDDHLFFVGRRTSFGLSSDQVAGKALLGNAVSGLRHEIDLPLCVTCPAGTVRVSFEAIDEKGQRRSYELYQALKSWQTSGNGGQLPPLTLGPGVPSEATLLLRAVGTIALWALLAAYVVAFAFEFSFFGAALAALVLCVFPAGMGFWPPLLPYHAWRDRRRLRLKNP